jgi:hypothetical protein
MLRRSKASPAGKESRVALLSTKLPLAAEYVLQSRLFAISSTICTIRIECLGATFRGKEPSNEICCGELKTPVGKILRTVASSHPSHTSRLDWAHK